MTVRLLIGPAGSGKTTRALQEFRQFTPLQQHESVRFVLPSITQVLDLRRLVLSDWTHKTHKSHMTHSLPGLLGDPFCTFQRLAGEMVGAQPITETQKRLLLGQLPIPEYFGNSPNLPAALSTIIRELKRSLISPDDLRQAAVHLLQTSQAKASALAAAYVSYETALAERSLQDSEGILWQAIRHSLAMELIIVDGFPRLYPIHHELIRHFANHSDVLVTTDGSIDLPNATVEHLPPTTHNLEPITLASLDAIASEIKKLLREGFRLDEIAVVARDLRPYQQRIARIFGEHGIQLMTESFPLAGSPLANHIASGGSIANYRWPEGDQLRRDCAAWKAIRRIMAEIEAGEALLGRKLDPKEYERELSSAIRRATFRISNGSGVVLSDVDMLGGRKFRAAFIIGLVERRQAYEDPFLLDFERDLLNPHLPHPLELSTARQDHIDIAACATERLYLSDSESEGDIFPAIEDAETLMALRRRTILDCFTAEDEPARHTAAAAYNLLLDKGALGPGDFEPIPDEIGEPA